MPSRWSPRSGTVRPGCWSSSRKTAGRSSTVRACSTSRPGTGPAADRSRPAPPSARTTRDQRPVYARPGVCMDRAGAQSPGARRSTSNERGGAVSLANQKVLIIGGSSGIGLATARAAASAGAAVTIAARSPERLNAALAELPGGCDAEVVDSNDEDELATLFARIGELDHLAYTAGGPLDPKAQGTLAGISLDAARDVFEARFWGAVAAVKHAAPRIRPGGSVTLTSGATAVRPSGRTTLPDASAGAGAAPAQGVRGRAGPDSRHRRPARDHPDARADRDPRAAARAPVQGGRRADPGQEAG